MSRLPRETSLWLESLGNVIRFKYEVVTYYIAVRPE